MWKVSPFPFTTQATAPATAPHPLRKLSVAVTLQPTKSNILWKRHAFCVSFLLLIAKAIGLKSAFGLMKKVKNENEFKAKEINALCELLNITSLKEKERIFFAKKVD